MERISTYTVGADVGSLREAFARGELPPALFDPLQSMLQRLTQDAANRSSTAYLFSDPDRAELRNLFGYVLMRAFVQHMPSALLVDCDFTNVGLSGIVPERDALGFLDLLLYGSSLGVITQETSGGVNVIGAGSFPVTKKMPFVPDAFREAAQQMARHGRCVVFCGPLHDDEGGLHPIISAVDVPIFMRGDGSAETVDPIEDELSQMLETELVSVRVTTPVAPIEPVVEAQPEPEPEPEPEPPPVLVKELEPEVVMGPELEPARVEPSETSVLPSEMASVLDRPPRKAPDDASSHAPEEVPGLPYHQRHYSSMLPRIATIVVGAIIVVVVGWWLIQQRSKPPQSTPPAQTTSSQQSTPSEPAAEQLPPAGAEQVDTTGTAATTPSPTDSAAAGPAQDQVITQPVVSTDDMLVMSDLSRRWAGQYVVHISSFRESNKARDEVLNLAGLDLPVFIVYADLGGKGSWYRIYAGPTATRDEARELKKTLDAIPRVKFTRITKVRG